jgi:hypothetical protein
MCLLLRIESTAFGLLVVVISMASIFYVTSSIAWLDLRRLIAGCQKYIWMDLSGCLYEMKRVKIKAS